MALSRALLARLKEIVGPVYVLTRPEDVVVYEQDAFLVAHALPDIVVLPGSAAEVAGVVRAAHEPHSRDRSTKPAGRGRTGGRQCRSYRGGCAPRIVLRARPRQPECLHHRR